MTETKKYKVKEGCRIFDQGIEYKAGDEVELPLEKALFHAVNIELIKEKKQQKTVAVTPKEDKGDGSKSQKDATGKP